jgi:hypothetical protein
MRWDMNLLLWYILKLHSLVLFIYLFVENVSFQLWVLCSFCVVNVISV